MNRRLVLVGALALGGCGLSERPYLERTQYPLLVHRPQSVPPRAGRRVLLVRTVQAAPGLNARGLQTLQPDGTMQVDFYNEWLVPPAEAVEAGLREWLAASGLFTAVIGPGSRIAADVVLESELNAFWVDAAAGLARVDLGVVTIDQRGGGKNVTLQRQISAQAPVSGPKPADAANGLRQATRKLFSEAEAALAIPAGAGRIT